MITNRKPCLSGRPLNIKEMTQRLSLRWTAAVERDRILSKYLTSPSFYISTKTVMTLSKSRNNKDFKWSGGKSKLCRDI